ncbi:MAG: inorganic diphosphatase, partial [Bifidobacterium sp.]|nr:inorganic diphosphatase [Bifidobacterium sp.]
MVTDSVFPGCVIKCRAVGLYHMVDEEGGDDKVLAVPDDVRYDHIKDIDDVSEFHKAEIKHFFEQYKALEPGKEAMPGDYWAGVDKAEAEIKAARERLAKKQAEEHAADLNN